MEKILKIYKINKKIIKRDLNLIENQELYIIV
jgi:hypothetical protein